VRAPAVRDIAAIPAAAALLATAYELVLLAAAATDRGEPQEWPGELPSMVVLVPAHNEEAVLERTLRALGRASYPADLLEVIVIADNCTDATAEVARRCDATVWTRDVPDARGKGQALAWAIARLESERPDASAVVFVDADCSVSPNFLLEVAGALADGAAAVQADYVVASPDESVPVALRYAAFRVVNTMRPHGKTRLGLSAGLLGTGMGFRRETLAAIGWQARSIVEDREQHLLLVAAGGSVRFLPAAEVTSPMPAGAAAETQESRWEGGRLEVARKYVWPLLVRAARERDPRLAHATLDELVPPRSMIVMAAGAGLLGGRRAATLAAATYAGQAAVVLGSLVLAKAPRSVYRALPFAPVFVARRLTRLARVAAHGTPAAWQRTERKAPAA
jgi:hypothetical protein